MLARHENMVTQPTDEADDLCHKMAARMQEKFGRKPEDLVGFIYLLRFRELTKIGWSCDVEQRIRQFNELLPDSVLFEHPIPVSNVLRAEDWLHRRFAAKRKKGEWFVLDGAAVAYIKSLSDGFYEESLLGLDSREVLILDHGQTSRITRI